MCDACHINGSWGSKEVGPLLLLYEDGKPESRGPSFGGRVDPSTHHVLKKKMYHFLDISLHSIRVIQGIKLK